MNKKKSAKMNSDSVLNKISDQKKILRQKLPEDLNFNVVERVSFSQLQMEQQKQKNDCLFSF